MSKSIYINDECLNCIGLIKKCFGKLSYEPSDIGIITAALKVYYEKLKQEETKEKLETKLKSHQEQV